MDQLLFCMGRDRAAEAGQTVPTCPIIVVYTY